MTSPPHARRLMVLLLVAACNAPTADSVPTSTTLTTRVSTASTTEEPGATSIPPTSGTLLVLGDWGSGTADQAEVAARMEAFAEDSQVDAILTTGDNFYEDDHATLLAPYQWAVDSGIDFWITWGNHDIESPSRIAAVNSAFGDPPRWTTKTWGATEIIILDSNQVDSEAQKRFLEGEMSRIEVPTIVAFHHPAYSCSSHDATKSIDFGWVPVFDEDVVLVLNGHAHNFQRFDVKDISYVVSGGGGAGLHPVEACDLDHPPRVAGSDSFHFLTITQSPSGLVVTAIDQDGNALDRFAVPLQPRPDSNLQQPGTPTGTASRLSLAW